MNVYQKLINAKSTVCVAQHNGRTLYEVQLSAIWRQKNMDMFNRVLVQHPDYELLRKEQVTGNPLDSGWILIDKTEQNKSR